MLESPAAKIFGLRKSFSLTRRLSSFIKATAFKDERSPPNRKSQCLTIISPRSIIWPARPTSVWEPLPKHSTVPANYFCGSDQIARGCADALREAGVRVPEDVALVSMKQHGLTWPGTDSRGSSSRSRALYF
jgi:Periplasmic binding protein-like domain